MRALLPCLMAFCFLSGAAQAASCPVPKSQTFKVVRQIHRSQLGFTEGLEWHEGAIWESTGDLFGESHINRIDPATGRVASIVNAGKDYFGEGLTFFGERTYQTA